MLQYPRFCQKPHLGEQKTDGNMFFSLRKSRVFKHAQLKCLDSCWTNYDEVPQYDLVNVASKKPVLTLLNVANS